MDREQNIQERSEAETRKKRRAQNSGRRLSPEQLSQQQQLATTRRHGLCYTSQVAPKVTSIKTNVTRCRKEEGKTREVVKVQRLRNCFFFFLVALDLSWRGRGMFGGRLQKPTAPWLRKTLQQITREHMQRLPGKDSREVRTLGLSTGIV